MRVQIIEELATPDEARYAYTVFSMNFNLREGDRRPQVQGHQFIFSG